MADSARYNVIVSIKMSPSKDEDARIFVQIANLKHWDYPLWQTNRKYCIYNVYKTDLHLDNKFKLFYQIKKATFSHIT